MLLLNRQDELMFTLLERSSTERAQIKSILELKAVNLSYLKCSLIWRSRILLLPRRVILWPLKISSFLLKPLFFGSRSLAVMATYQACDPTLWDKVQDSGSIGISDKQRILVKVYVPNIEWDTHRKKYSLFIWTSTLTRHPISLFAHLAMLSLTELSCQAPEPPTPLSLNPPGLWFPPFHLTSLNGRKTRESKLQLPGARQGWGIAPGIHN